jgi:hypothetical protein
MLLAKSGGSRAERALCLEDQMAAHDGSVYAIEIAENRRPRLLS